VKSLSFQPNCKPNYESVMNYLFQVQGLICDARSTSPQCKNKADGTPVIDYSRQQLPELNETSLTESLGLGTMAYRTRWYAPRTSSFIDNDTTGLATTPPTRYCDGTPITDSNQVAMVRVDGTSVTGGIDWNGDGTIASPQSTPPYSQDINFSGSFTSFDAGIALGLNGKPQGDDWANVDLRHTASRRNVGGLSLGVYATDLSDGDLLGKGDTGKGDTGKGDTGKGDTGKGDTGKGDTGKGDTGKGDTGSAAAPVGDLELDTASALGNAPNTLTATNALKSITLNWKRPNVGTPTSYKVYRVIGTTVTPANFALKVLVGTVSPVLPATLPATTIVDANVRNHTTYTYFAIAEFAGGIRSGTSNYVTQPH
jgi:hypothetical protein